MGDTGAHGRVPGRLRVWCPQHSCVHPVPLLTHEKCRGRWGAKHLKGMRGKPGRREGSESSVRGVPGLIVEVWTHDLRYAIRRAEFRTGAEGARNTGSCVKSHLFHRMLSTRSVPRVSRIHLETPGVSWGGVGRASGGCAPDAGVCRGSGWGGVLKQVGALSSKFLCRESQGGKSDVPTALELPFHPCPPPRSRDQVLPGWSWGTRGSGAGFSRFGGGEEMTY